MDVEWRECSYRELIDEFYRDLEVTLKLTNAGLLKLFMCMFIRLVDYLLREIAEVWDPD